MTSSGHVFQHQFLSLVTSGCYQQLWLVRSRGPQQGQQQSQEKHSGRSQTQSQCAPFQQKERRMGSFLQTLPGHITIPTLGFLGASCIPYPQPLCPFFSVGSVNSQTDPVSLFLRLGGLSGQQSCGQGCINTRRLFHAADIINHLPYCY